MRKVHLISVTEPPLFDLALAIHQKGYEVSVSGVGLTDTTLARLEKEGCTCHGDGWFPERLTKDIHFVVLGPQSGRITRIDTCKGTGIISAFDT